MEMIKQALPMFNTFLVKKFQINLLKYNTFHSMIYKNHIFKQFLQQASFLLNS